MKHLLSGILVVAVVGDTISVQGVEHKCVAMIDNIYIRVFVANVILAVRIIIAQLFYYALE